MNYKRKKYKDWLCRGGSKVEGIKSIKRSFNSDFAVVFVLFFIILVIGPFIPNFFSANNLVNLFVRTTISATAAIGMTYVILTGGIDLSIGGIIILVAYIGTETFLKGFGLNVWIVALFMALIGALIGLVNGFSVVSMGMPPFIATLAMMNITRGMAHYFYEAKTVFGLPESYYVFGQANLWGFPVPIIICLLFLIAAYFVLRYTTMGRCIYAIGSNITAAWLAGIKVKRVKYSAYIISGFTAGVASVLLTSRLSSVVAGLGLGVELDVIAAVVIGGTSLFGGAGGVIGSAIGALIITTVTNILTLTGVSPFLELVAKGIVLWIAVLMDMIRKGEVFKSNGS